MNFIKLKPDLYLLKIESYDYQIGYDFYKNLQTYYGLCSAFRKGDIIGRNFDWYNDGHVEVIVQNRPSKGVYANVGVAHTQGKLTVDLLKEAYDGLYSVNDLIPLIPFLTCDCLNEKGLYCSINVVPAGDKGELKPVGTTGQPICQAMLPRYLCDKAASVDEAIELMENMIIFPPSSGSEDCHLFLCDENNTVVIEFIDGELKVIEGNNIMTNFYLDGWNGTIASKILGSTDEEILASGLTDHAMGLERYNIISSKYGSIETANDAADVLEMVKYTNLYNENTNPFWYSELYSNTETFGDLTIYSTAAQMEDIKQYSFDHEDWISTHSSIYDLAKKEVIVYSNEQYVQPVKIGIDKRPLYGILNIEELYPDFKSV